MSEEVKSAIVSHQVVRLELGVRESYDVFRDRFESAVPTWDRERGSALVNRKASWPEVVAEASTSAPHDFLLYWKLDLAPLMSLAGNTRRATEYLIGNHVIAETMYRHDPGVALYVPLRCAIYESGGGARFSIEQPSTNLSVLGRDEINSVGIELDRKVARLLAALNVEVPKVLNAAGRTRSAKNS
jgi:hypothetical protein